VNVIELDHPDAAHAVGRPLPEPDNTSAHYWAAAAGGSLVFQRCLECGHAQFYPRPLCIRCAGDTVWEEASGEGAVHTFTVIRQNLAPPFGELGAYVVAMIDLAEGPRMMSNVTHVEPDEVRVGMGVTAYSVKVRDDMGLPFWRPSSVEGASSE
jgi:uncharacterized OB-fold protein